MLSRTMLVGPTLLAVLALTGCEHTGGTAMPSNFGEATRQTMAAQVIDPDPAYDYSVPETSAAHAAQAAERYRTDKVKQPERVRTTNVGNGGSSGGN